MVLHRSNNNIPGVIVHALEGTQDATLGAGLRLHAGSVPMLLAVVNNMLAKVSSTCFALDS